MIENLEIDLARVVCLYKHRSELFEWNGREPAFSLRDVIRHELFAKAQAAGFTPVPSAHFLHWTLDLVCLRGLRPEQVYLIRMGPNDDYRPLLLFPRSIEKILVAATESAVPPGRQEFKTVLIPKQPTTQIENALPPTKVCAEYATAFREAYGFDCIYTQTQLIGAASRVATFWISNGDGANLKEYFVWRMKRARNGAEPGTERVLHLLDMLQKDALAAFKLERQGNRYDSEWATKGWGSLGSR